MGSKDPVNSKSDESPISEHSVRLSTSETAPCVFKYQISSFVLVELSVSYTQVSKASSERSNKWNIAKTIATKYPKSILLSTEL